MHDGKAGESPLSYRRPAKRDGALVWSLISKCPPLDQNSMYCNFLQCAHFSDTCVIAERDGAAIGWVSAYRRPDKPETLFVWQVAVHPSARGKGLGKALLRALLSSKGAEGASEIQTTITPDNEPSRALFRSIAESLSAPLAEENWLHRDSDFNGAHDTEILVMIGPFAPAPVAAELKKRKRN